MKSGFRSTWSSLQRTLHDFTRFWREGHEVPAVTPDLDRSSAECVQKLMVECLTARGGQVAARQQAAILGELYLKLNDKGRQRFFKIMIDDFAIDRGAAKQAATELIEAIDNQAFTESAARLRQTLETPQQHLLRLFNALPNGIKFLIDMRADLLSLQSETPEFKSLDGEFRSLLATWFDVGFLEVERLEWNSPAVLLEKLITYEAVHSIQSWQDLHNRLESDRHCYAFFHPVLPEEPLIFIEVALVEGLATSIQVLLDQSAPEIDPVDADTAIFYSISNTQRGLQGISFGPFLIKQVVTQLQSELPNLKTFSTLSPMPGFRRWLSAYLKEVEISGLEEPLIGHLSEAARMFGCLEPLAVFDQAGWYQNQEHPEIKERILCLAARYLQSLREKDKAPLDPVARFHLGNGARIEQLNWLGDISTKGMQESCGLMVNYLYRLKDIEKNIEAYAASHQIAVSSKIRNLMRDGDDDERWLKTWTRLLTARKGSEHSSEPCE